MVDRLRKSALFLKGDFFKVFSYTAFSTLIKMLTGLVSVKFIAILIGPSGIALLGQLNNFTSITLIIASAGINNGITKYIAEFKDSKNEVRKLLSSALIISLISSILTGLLMVVFNKWLSNTILKDESFGYVFSIFGLTVSFYALNGLLASILNGFKEFKRFVFLNIVGSIVGLIFTLVLVYFWGVKGALVSVVTSQSVILVISIYIVRKSFWLKWSNFNLLLDTPSLKKYFKYSLMTFVTAATAPVGQLLLRGYIIDTISPTQAGWWEAMNRISNMYLMVITTSFSVYYLPRLSEILNEKELKAEILKAFKIIIPTLLVGFVILYFTRFLVIRILLTRDFEGMQQLFIWQLIGDFFKISSWILAYIMVAKTMTKEFILSEILFTTLFVAVAFMMIKSFGVAGITQAYAINYFLYLVAMLVLFRKLLFRSSSGI